MRSTARDHRLTPARPGLVKIDGKPAIRCIARKGTFCSHSGKPINRGDRLYRHLFDTMEHGKRWLASKIEVIEARHEQDRR
jgi:hypothetical protein